MSKIAYLNETARLHLLRAKSRRRNAEAAGKLKDRNSAIFWLQEAAASFREGMKYLQDSRAPFPPGTPVAARIAERALETVSFPLSSLPRAKLMLPLIFGLPFVAENLPPLIERIRSAL